MTEKQLKYNTNSSKYRSKKFKTDGILFDSIKEGHRYQELKIQAKTGFISNLRLQVPYVLNDPFDYKGEHFRAIKYKADFVYINKDGVEIVEDTKGYHTPEYKLKKKLLLKRYPSINFIET